MWDQRGLSRYGNGNGKWNSFASKKPAWLENQVRQEGYFRSRIQNTKLSQGQGSLALLSRSEPYLNHTVQYIAVNGIKAGPLTTYIGQPDRVDACCVSSEQKLGDGASVGLRQCAHR